MPKSKISKPIPKFDSEDAEREFWALEDSSDYVDWSSAARTLFPELKPSTKSETQRRD